MIIYDYISEILMSKGISSTAQIKNMTACERSSSTETVILDQC